MIEKEVIYNTEYIDRELPTVTYEKVKTTGMTEHERIFISVSDKTSREALRTLEKIRRNTQHD